MIRPAFLKKGDTVAIVSTARKISKDELLPAIALLKAWQLNISIGTTINASKNQFAGSDAVRIADFQQALDNPDITAVLCARGGYGTVRIIDKLDFSHFLKRPKWIVGYSDVTVLHNALHTLGCETIHATMPINIAENSKAAIASLKNALFGEKVVYKVPSHPFNRVGFAEGVLVGGNLSILYSLLGSKSTIDPTGKILFIEDLDEYLYHIDRMLINLQRNNWFEGLKGLVVGGMTHMNDNEVPFGKSALEIIKEIVAQYDFPVLFGFPAGHIDNNCALVMGRTVKLEVGNTGARLTFLD